MTSRKGRHNAGGMFIGGEYMASRAEAERYLQLLDLQRRDRIANIQRQVSFILTVKNTVITVHRVDFRYDVLGDRGQLLRTVLEDVKGMLTPEYKLKRALFDALEPIRISLIHVARSEPEAAWGARVLEHAEPTENGISGAGFIARHWNHRIPD